MAQLMPVSGKLNFHGWLRAMDVKIEKSSGRLLKNDHPQDGLSMPSHENTPTVRKSVFIAMGEGWWD